MEGIVSKRIDAPYRSGNASDWVKVKCAGRREANKSAGGSLRRSANAGTGRGLQRSSHKLPARVVMIRSP